jgi:hypothetical protein
MPQSRIPDLVDRCRGVYLTQIDELPRLKIGLDKYATMGVTVTYSG